MTWVYIGIAAVVIIGIIWWAMSRKGKGEEEMGGTETSSMSKEEPTESEEEKSV